MKLTLVAVGRLRPALREVMDDYLRRLARSVPVVERELREAGREPDTSKRIAEEDRRILAALPEGSRLVLLDRTGAQLLLDVVGDIRAF
ncbi:MAG TPA: 23S rRNA (pseudouridine(1915)-N(3))-methyltransferase RlmH [Gemmatimonadales bacterium]|nr:23S rRNA (pseudouridine(1915)-N(3))-methyltransferase RlmH [Gemmatimonadales bacterium]